MQATRQNTILIFFNPRDISITYHRACLSGLPILRIRYLAHDIAFKVAQAFVKATDYEFVIWQVDDVLAYRVNYDIQLMNARRFPNAVVDVVAPLGMGMGVNKVLFAVTDKVLERRPLTYWDYAFWDFDTFQAKYNEKRYHRVFHTGYSLPIMRREIFLSIDFKPMARVISKVFGRRIKKPMQIDVHTSMELYKKKIPLIVDTHNVVLHFGNLRYLVPREKRDYKVTYINHEGVERDITGMFPIEKWYKEIETGTERLFRIRSWFRMVTPS